MNPLDQGNSSKNTVRATLGTVAKLVAIIAATFAFAAFSSAPADTPNAAKDPAPHLSR